MSGNKISKDNKSLYGYHPGIKKKRQVLLGERHNDHFPLVLSSRTDSTKRNSVPHPNGNGRNKSAVYSVQGSVLEEICLACVSFIEKHD
jgi:hypothetical protein